MKKLIVFITENHHNNRSYDPCIACDVNGLLNGNEYSETWAKAFSSKEKHLNKD